VELARPRRVACEELYSGTARARARATDGPGGMEEPRARVCVSATAANQRWLGVGWAWKDGCNERGSTCQMLHPA